MAIQINIFLHRVWPGICDQLWTFSLYKINERVTGSASTGAGWSSTQGKDAELRSPHPLLKRDVKWVYCTNSMPSLLQIPIVSIECALQICSQSLAFQQLEGSCTCTVCFSCQLWLDGVESGHVVARSDSRSGACSEGAILLYHYALAGFPSCPPLALALGSAAVHM